MIYDYPELKINEIKEFIELKNNDSMNQRINKIYGLIDPRDNTLFYIGCTIVRMHIRLSAHFNENTHMRTVKKDILYDIVLNGYFPKVEIFYRIEDKYTARIIEKFITNFTIQNKYNSKLVNSIGSSKNITTKVNIKK